MHNPTGAAADATTDDFTHCPAWCITDHGNGVDVEHESAHELLAAAGDCELVGQLLADPGQAPRLSLAICEGVEALGSVDLSVDDAEQLMTRLQTLITAARGLR
ncbi:DUF6907 domain-containing protein [Streptosporangium sandarakinum]|uniref:DUF6907 domain-containing protein n=1 Tax=Streptosporangium sandarakinum TaxID=1260955 RepID=UPI0036CF9FD2